MAPDANAIGPTPPVPALGETPRFSPGESVTVQTRYPIGHYRVPLYLRGCPGVVEAVIGARSVNNEEEGYGRNAGGKRYYYRLAVPLAAAWPEYEGSAHDVLHIEVHEDWLMRTPA